MRPGRPAAGVHRAPRWRRRCTSSSACTRRCGTHRARTSTRSSAAAGSPTRACSPTHSRPSCPASSSATAHAFAPDEVDFYERLATSARRWIEARPTGPQPRAQRLPARQPDVRHRRRRPAHGGRGRLAGLRPRVRAVRRVVHHRQRAHRRRPCAPTRSASSAATTTALVAAGVDGYSFDECWDEYGRSLLSALMTTIFGAMYGVRSERGDEMFVHHGRPPRPPDPRPRRRPLPRADGVDGPTPRACVVPVS